MAIEKFRESALDALRGKTDNVSLRAAWLIQAENWGGSVGNFQGDDYIVLNGPYNVRGETIFDNSKRGVNGDKIASIMCSIAKQQIEREEAERITAGNQQLVGRCRNMFTHLTHPSVSVAPSDTREGYVRLNGWGEFTEGGVKVVFDALKAADEAIKAWGTR